MKLREKISGAGKKAALAAVALGGFLAFAGAGTASAHPRVVVGVGIGGPVVVRGYVPAYLAPRRYYAPVYVGPRYGYGYYRGPRVRYWDERFHCWRYR
jgi:hypothetical protein